MKRRTFLHTGLATTASFLTARAAKATQRLKLVDTHQHLWDLTKFKPPWLGGAPPVLGQSYVTTDYKKATAGFDVRAIYMEVDVALEDQLKEANHVIALSKDSTHPTEAAVISGRPNTSTFQPYITQFKNSRYIKGVRQVLHVDSTPRGLCLKPQFIESMKLLGRLNMSFDLCMRPTEVVDGFELARKCPDTTFIIDHCGNADPKAFATINKQQDEASHKPNQWKKDMAKVATQQNCICKISGIIARAPSGWSPDHLAPIVNFCLDEFGPDRVVFGGDWPVCLLGAPLAGWINALQSIVSTRSTDDQDKLFYRNAERIYRLS